MAAYRILNHSIMMSALNSAEISRLVCSIKIINNISPATVSSILGVIVKRLCEDQQHISHHIFHEDEKSRLKELLSLDELHLNLVISTLQYIIHQASFHVMKPASFAKYLNELGFSEQLSTIISELWSVHAKSVIDTLKKESYTLLKLGSVESSIHYSLSSQSGGHTKVPLALLHFNLATDTLVNKSTLSLEFSHKELLHFYQMLEKVQSNLDQLI